MTNWEIGNTHVRIGNKHMTNWEIGNTHVRIGNKHVTNWEIGNWEYAREPFLRITMCNHR